MTNTVTPSPCPFCGNASTSISSNGFDNVFVTCECGAEGPACDDELSARLAWNRRAPGSSTASAVVTVSADALHQVLQALVGPGHLIRELQATRSLHKLGHPNAIETLIETYQAALAKPAKAPNGDEDAYVIDRLGKLLADVAIALKGEELPLHLHSYHDLPDVARVLKLELDLYRATFPNGVPDSATAAPVQAPEGFVLVPIEPTPAMLHALWQHRVSMRGTSENKIARESYRALLAAAPIKRGA